MKLLTTILALAITTVSAQVSGGCGGSYYTYYTLDSSCKTISSSQNITIDDFVNIKECNSCMGTVQAAPAGTKAAYCVCNPLASPSDRDTTGCGPIKIDEVVAKEPLCPQSKGK